MTLTLTVDGEKWRHHLVGVAAATPGLVPVAKGNGYGFGLARLARRTEWLKARGLGCDTLAVGTYDEVAEVAQRCTSDIVVLTPWRPFGAALEVDPLLDGRLIHTVSRPEDLTDLLAREPKARFVLELATSMQRHGMSGRDLRTLSVPTGARLEGVAVHLPLAQGSHLGEVQRQVNDVVAAGLPTTTIWTSHLTAAELRSLRSSWPDFTFRPRVGTDLWLGERSAMKVTATVLDVHAVDRGDLFGYRGRSAPKAGHLLVVSGGTAHGIGLEAPTGDTSIKSRAATLARGGLDAVGFVRSPFFIGGKQRLFAEPPHMQASMLFLPSGPGVPAVGEEIDVRVRYTTTLFDRVVIS